MYTIAKSFEFDFGHRVWNQELRTDYADDTKCVCRHLHGHRAKVIIYLQSGYLHNGMVTDFKHLDWFKEFIKKSLDHKFILDINDPLKGIINSANVPMIYDEIEKKDYAHYATGNLFNKEEVPPYYLEFLDSFIFVPFVPTAENFAKWIYDIVEKEMNALPNVFINAVEFYETPNCCAKYGDI
jgi:6-pyruvoyltetrahydropterin/6-carboxytetrahydropterin synthase